jgi:hypothetical protein
MSVPRAIPRCTDRNAISSAPGNEKWGWRPWQAWLLLRDISYRSRGWKHARRPGPPANGRSLGLGGRLPTRSVALHFSACWGGKSGASPVSAWSLALRSRQPGAATCSEPVQPAAAHRHSPWHLQVSPRIGVQCTTPSDMVSPSWRVRHNGAVVECGPPGSGGSRVNGVDLENGPLIESLCRLW